MSRTNHVEGDNARSKRLSWEEIQKRYPDEWVCLVDEDASNMGPVVSGVVYAHDPHHNALLKKQKHLKEAGIERDGRPIPFRTAHAFRAGAATAMFL
jgi:hypothetical protein